MFFIIVLYIIVVWFNIVFSDGILRNLKFFIVFRILVLFIIFVMFFEIVFIIVYIKLLFEGNVVL